MKWLSNKNDQVLYMSLAVIFIGACIASAAGLSSSSYTVESDVISCGGGESSSDNYFIEHTTGQSSAIGESSSDNYLNYAGFWYTVPPVAIDDSDGDGVPDSIDNCMDVVNPGQRDSNYPEDDDPGMDGYQHYGNACDADYDNNGFVGLEDFNDLRTCFGQSASPDCPDVDCDGNGFIGLEDFNCLRTFFGGTPGPGTGG